MDCIRQWGYDTMFSVFGFILVLFMVACLVLLVLNCPELVLKWVAMQIF